MNIGICIIAYNRLDSLKRVLTSISKGYYDQSVSLIISIDKSNSNTVGNYADSFEWPYGDKHIIKHEVNLGLRKHVLKCGDLTLNYDGLIVLEDDITVAESFFIYAKQCIEKFKEDDNIAGISLYNFPINYQTLLPFYPLQSDSDVFLMNCAQSWGQVWMPRQWMKFREWYDKNCDEFVEMPHLPKAICSWPKSSWLKYHTRYCIEQHKYFIYPYTSLSTNNGDTGTHVNRKSILFQAPILYGIKKTFNINPTIKYDGFFENKLLYKILNLNPEEICIDFYGEKQNRQQCRYWLTRKHLPYKIIHSFTLELFPYEMNIYENRKGSDFFIYDTAIKDKNKSKNTEFQFYCYIYHWNNLRKLIRGSIKHIILESKFKLLNKI